MVEQLAGDDVLEVMTIDPDKAPWIFCCGRKGSGKSHLAHRYWDSYPLDRMVIDTTHDIDPHDEKAEILRDPLPGKWPRSIDPQAERSTLRYIADPGSDTYFDDLDRAVGLAVVHGNCILWLDEVGELTTASRTKAHTRRAFKHSRHHNLALLLCDPRPQDINPLCIAQADYVAVFDTPHELDRKRLAAGMGISTRELDTELDALGKFEFLWYVAETHDLFAMPPLPPSRWGGRRREHGDRFSEPTATS